MGYLLYRYFPDARGSGMPQTKAALFAREGRITLGTVLGKFFCTSGTLASGRGLLPATGNPAGSSDAALVRCTARVLERRRSRSQLKQRPSANQLRIWLVPTYYPGP
jgi:hypothetical protein